MSMQYILLLAVLSLLLVGEANAEGDDRSAILALMDQAFAAVGSGNPDDARATQLAQGTSLSFRPRPGGKPGEQEMRISTNEALVVGGIGDDHKYFEKWAGEPTVIIRGPIAVVWGEYEFWVDGDFSHCGIDSVQLAKVDGHWKIANWSWTVETESCRPSD